MSIRARHVKPSPFNLFSRTDRHSSNSDLGGVSFDLLLDASAEDLDNFKSVIHHSEVQSIFAIHAHILDTFRKDGVEGRSKYQWIFFTCMKSFLTIILNNMYSITNIKFNKLQNWTLWQFNEKTKQGAWHMFFDGCIFYLLRINHLFSCNRSDTCCIKPSKTSSIGA